MSVPTYVGFTTLQLHLKEGPVLNPKGADHYVLEYRGAGKNLEREAKKWRAGSKAPGFPGMEMVRNLPVDAGLDGTLRLEFVGDSGRTKPDNPIREQYSRPQTTVTLTDQYNRSVDFTYYPRSVEVVWIHRGKKAPTSPLYAAKASKQLNLEGSYMSPDLPGVTARSMSRERTILQTFDADEIAPNVWQVRESWFRGLIARTDPSTGDLEPG